MVETVSTADISKKEQKFAADRMLGRLVKWLRVLGQDVIYGPHLAGYGLIRAARRETRLILTRDRALRKKQPPEYLFINSDHYQEQLRQVLMACHIDARGRLFSRCLECNTLLRPVAKDSIKGRVPLYVFSTQEKFSWCPDCHRVYWPATHQQRMTEELERLGIV